MVTVERGQKELEKEFEGLVSKIFSPEIVEIQWHSAGHFIGVGPNLEGHCSQWELVFKKKPIQKKSYIFGLIKSEIREHYSYSDTVVKLVNQNKGRGYHIYEDGKYSPIIITVFDSKALEKSIKFAEEYEKLSSQSAKVIKEF